MKFKFINPNKKQNIEFGMVAALVILILAMYTGQFSYVKVAFVLILIKFVFPNIYSCT